jgi:small subunit ribosomal protein S8
MTDPIADMLTRIRNANRALLPVVEIPYSRLKERIGKILVKEGYVSDCAVEGAKIRKIKIKLKFQGRRGVIEGLRRISSPGLRRYVAVDEIPRVRGGLGTAIVSTSQGVMTGVAARRSNLGGELLCYVW